MREKAQAFIETYPSVQHLSRTITARWEAGQSWLCLFPTALRALPGMPVRITWPCDVVTAYQAIEAETHRD